MLYRYKIVNIYKNQLFNPMHQNSQHCTTRWKKGGNKGGKIVELRVLYRGACTAEQRARLTLSHIITNTHKDV